MSEIGIFMRTHTINESFLSNFKSLVANTSYEVNVLIDETNNDLKKNIKLKEIEKQSQIYFYTNTLLSKYDLFIHPNSGWHCGDYALIHLFKITKFKFILMVDYDCRVNVNIDRIIQSLYINNIDLSGKKIENKNWDWIHRFNEWILITSNYKGLLKTEDTLGVFFPLVWCSKPFSKHLLEKRNIHKDLIISKNISLNLYPFSEIFTGYESRIGNFRFKDLSELIDTNKLTFKNLFHISKIINLSGIYHPCLENIEYIEKLISRNTDKEQLLLFEKNISKYVENIHDINLYKTIISVAKKLRNF